MESWSLLQKSSCGTAADMTTRCTFKIEDPSRGPGRVDFRAPDEGSGLEGTPKPKIQRDPSRPKREPYIWAAAVHGPACVRRRFVPGPPMVHVTDSDKELYFDGGSGSNIHASTRHAMRKRKTRPSCT
jgi:hypothetical protein